MIACAVIVFAGWGGFQVVKGLFEFGASVADERADARTWLNDHVEPGQTVMGEFGTPYVGRSDIAQQEVGLLSELDLDDLRDGKIDWVVSSSETTSGIFSDQARWAARSRPTDNASPACASGTCFAVGTPRFGWGERVPRMRSE